MRTLLLSTAAALVVVANLWAVASALRHRREAVGGTLELTEAEARAERLTDSTVTYLQWRWSASSAVREDRRTPAWLDAARLGELGFDVSVPLDATHARAHYRSQPPIEVWVAVTLTPVVTGDHNGELGLPSRLVVLDADRDPGRLRERHPDVRERGITRALVRLVYRDWRRPGEGESAGVPRLEGRIETLLPGGVFVPRPMANTLLAVLAADRERERRDDEPGPGPKEPRYAVTVSWGTAGEPWVTGLRRLGTPGTGDANGEGATAGAVGDAGSETQRP